MLKKVVRTLSPRRDRSPSPEFVSHDARAHERQVATRSASGDRASLMRDNLYTQLTGTEASGHVYLDTGLEALSLEPIIGPSLGRMRPSLKIEEGLLPPMPTRGRLPALPDAAHTRAVNTVTRDTVFLRRPTPDIVITPAPERKKSAGEVDPFDLEFKDTVAPVLTPMPKRPAMQRKAASYRTQRELPLRVQAVRRSHQEQFAQKLLAQSEVRRQEFVARGAELRRASEADLPKLEAPVRPAIDPLQRQGRAHSHAPNSSMNAPQVRSRSTSREPSRRRHERLPSGPHRNRSATLTPPERDHYLDMALNAWSFD